MTATTPRTWTETDRVAIRDWVGEPWRLGTVAGITGLGYLLIRGDAGDVIAIRRPDDPRVVAAEQVPVDERHWLPQRVRDQLVRQEAAARLQAVAVALDHDDALLGLASLLGDVVGAGGGGWLPTGGSWVSTADLARAARALLDPVPEADDDEPERDASAADEEAWDAREDEVGRVLTADPEPAPTP